jgi:hypothetical protein
MSMASTRLTTSSSTHFQTGIVLIVEVFMFVDDPDVLVEYLSWFHACKDKYFMPYMQIYAA